MIFLPFGSLFKTFWHIYKMKLRKFVAELKEVIVSRLEETIGDELFIILVS